MMNLLSYILLWLFNLLRCAYYIIQIYVIGSSELLYQMLTPVLSVEDTDCILDGKVGLVTGGTSGIGLALTKNLCRMGMTVIVGSPEEQFPEEDRSHMEKLIKSQKLHLLHLDLSSFRSIEKFYAAVLQGTNQIDYLINNAGIMLVPFSRTRDGFEKHIGVNFIGHIYLTKLLLPIMNSSYSMIVNLGSSTSRIGSPLLLQNGEFHVEELNYSSAFQYGHSKLAVVLYTQALTNLLRKDNSNCSVVSVHPGVVSTRLYQHLYYPLQVLQRDIMSHICLRTADEGAQVVLRAMLNHDRTKDGSFFIFNEYRRPYVDEFNFSRFMQHIEGTIDEACAKQQ